MKENQYERDLIQLCKERMTSIIAPNIIICLDQLSDNDLWKAPPNQYSIGSIVLHCLEEIKLHTLQLHNPHTHYKSLENYFPVKNLSAKRLSSTYATVVMNWNDTVSKLKSEQTPIDEQRLVSLLFELNYYTGKIVDRSKQLSTKMIVTKKQLSQS
ncbi:hypothetical protein LC087_04705 [Bacillus carboniphilus]|uniref:DinB-like domain-containing protein n=1 Tax=Bacillus carboniphilus TaxID=86663 RepID=A0ABY9JVP1_9BACI|nr:hypothetical protein [Bacillus carboniphilus]WLR43474.1 hypothetical protein LC087_04705 [Bacillus carboniphilus]